MKYVVLYMCRTIKIWISNWPRKLNFSQFLQAGKACQLLLTFLTMVTCRSRSTSHFYALIGENLTGEFMRKFMQYLETCNCLLWRLKLTEFCVNLWYFWLSFFTERTKWNSAAIKSLLLFMASLFIGFLVEKYVACQSQKTDFRWHRFRFSPCLMHKRVEKSQAILALLDSFQCISNVKPE